MVPKRIQTCFDCNLGQFFRKNFAQFSMEGRVFEIFQKNQKIFKIPKTPKISKVSKRVLNNFVPKSIKRFRKILGQTFFFSHFSMEGRVFENFHKNQKKFQNSKNAQNGSQKNPNVF